jgi:hypothetical protein
MNKTALEWGYFETDKKDVSCDKAFKYNSHDT